MMDDKIKEMIMSADPTHYTTEELIEAVNYYEGLGKKIRSLKEMVGNRRKLHLATLDELLKNKQTEV